MLMYIPDHVAKADLTLDELAVYVRLLSCSQGRRDGTWHGGYDAITSDLLMGRSGQHTILMEAVRELYGRGIIHVSRSTDGIWHITPQDDNHIECPQCKKSFKPTNVRQKYCNQKCTRNACWHRNKEKWRRDE